MTAQIRQHVYYRGRVQGVGFRYTAVRCAEAYDVTGFVRNLDDGRVELVVEGAKADVQNLLDDIRTSMSGNIRQETSDTSDPTGEFRDFAVRY